MRPSDPTRSAQTKCRPAISAPITRPTLLRLATAVLRLTTRVSPGPTWDRLPRRGFPSLNPRRRLSLSRSAAFHLGQPLQMISSAYLRLKSGRVPFHVPTAHRAGRRAGHPLYVAADHARMDMKLEPWPATKSKGVGKRPPCSRDETLSNNSLCFHASTLSHCEGALRHGCQMLCISCVGKERRLPQTLALFWTS